MDTLSIIGAALGIIATAVALAGGYIRFVSSQGERGERSAKAVAAKAEAQADGFDGRLRTLELRVAELPKPPEMRGLAKSVNTLAGKIEGLDQKVDSIRTEIGLREEKTAMMVDAVARQVDGLGHRIETLTQHIMHKEAKE